MTNRASRHTGPGCACPAAGGVPGHRAGRGLHNDMGIGAAETEGTDPDNAQRQSRQRGRHMQGHGAAIDVGVERPEVHVRRHGLMTQHQHRLDQACHPGRRGGMTDVRLDRPHQEWPGAPREHGGQCVHLDGIAQRRACAMRLDGVHRLRLQVRIAQGRADHRFLCSLVRRGDAGTASILVQGGSANHPQHAIARRLGVRQPLQNHDAAALTLAESVSRGIERLAAPIRGHHPGATERNGHVGREHQVNPAGHGKVAFPGAKRLHGQMHGHQRR